jgi:hypothetical protein
MKRWHMILGLFFGLIVCTWAFSGMLSMDPFPLESDDDTAPAIAGALRGGGLDLAAFAAKPPSDALEQTGHYSQTKQLELSVFDGEPFYIARETPQKSLVVPVHGNPTAQFDAQRILDVVAKTVEPAHIEESR